jgi:Flp pilus assembly pilin Flp
VIPRSEKWHSIVPVGYFRRMGRRLLASESGQTQAEYVLVVAGIAMACIAAALILGAVLNGRFDSSAKPYGPGTGTFTPPSPPAQLVYPTRVDQCEKGGWQNYPQFADEHECLDYVENLAP